jgi:hypothetical protein
MLRSCLSLDRLSSRMVVAYVDSEMSRSGHSRGMLAPDKWRSGTVLKSPARWGRAACESAGLPQHGGGEGGVGCCCHSTAVALGQWSRHPQSKAAQYHSAI